jgi:hypothetical protein
MKKSKLIAMLNAIEGDPDIKLWNGMVGDWMEISPALVKSDLVRMNLDYWLESCRLQDCGERKDWDYQMPAEEIAELTKRHKSGKVNKWELNPYVTLEDIKAKRYSLKKILILQAKKKGETSWDRLGDISY